MEPEIRSEGFSCLALWVVVVVVVVVYISLFPEDSDLGEIVAISAVDFKSPALITMTPTSWKATLHICFGCQT